MSAAVNTARAPRGRLGFLDWTRGFAVLIILQGHVFHAYTHPTLRGETPYVMSQFLGGIAPAIFLILTGTTLAFLMHSREQQGIARSKRWQAALRRGGYLLMLAFAFRIQMWMFGLPWSRPSDVLRVDVLNCMGFAITLFSPLSLVTTRERARLAAFMGIAIAAASPVISATNWSWLPAWASDYFVPNLYYFSFFPWAAFIAFGVSIGSMLRLTHPERMARLMQWSAIAGLLLLLLGDYCSRQPYSIYSRSEFWLNSPWLVVMKLGAVLILLAGAYAWNARRAMEWSWLRQFGTTSLLVYWFHIELVYGRWFPFFKESLNAWQCIVCAAALVAVMLSLSMARTRLKQRPRLVPTAVAA